MTPVFFRGSLSCRRAMDNHHDAGRLSAMMGNPSTNQGGTEITLRDVIVHMEHMERRLLEQITANAEGIKKNTVAIADVKKTLTERIDALEEDLTATIHDTVRIRQHVGMPVQTE